MKGLEATQPKVWQWGKQKNPTKTVIADPVTLNYQHI